MRLIIKWVGSMMKSLDFNDGFNDIVEVFDVFCVFGDVWVVYILVDLFRRIILGLLFGLYFLLDYLWS